MKNTVSIIKKSVLCIVVICLVSNIIAQRPPDSLIQTVVVFKWPTYGKNLDSDMRAYIKRYGLPQASGFHFKSDTGPFYIVSAKHILPRSDSSIILQWGSALTSTGSSHLFSNSRNVGLFDKDTLIDLVLINNTPHQQVNELFPHISALHSNEILTKEEFYNVTPGTEIFFIGMLPDSLTAVNTYVWFPSGTLKTIFTARRIGRDATMNIDFAYDFELSIPGKKGVSGSAVYIEIGGRYKLFGIINGIKNSTPSCIVGTAGYRIMDILNVNMPVKMISME